MHGPGSQERRCGEEPLRCCSVSPLPLDQMPRGHSRQPPATGDTCLALVPCPSSCTSGPAFYIFSLSHPVTSPATFSSFEFSFPSTPPYPQRLRTLSDQRRPPHCPAYPLTLEPAQSLSKSVVKACQRKSSPFTCQAGDSSLALAEPPVTIRVGLFPGYFSPPGSHPRLRGLGTVVPPPFFFTQRKISD